MTDGPELHRRAADWPHATRIAVLEVEVQALKRLASKADDLIAKLDQRADRQDVALARLLAGLAVLMFLGQLAAPVVLRLIGVGT